MEDGLFCNQHTPVLGVKPRESPGLLSLKKKRGIIP